ncbi:FHA domain-containing protein [bacterium]|nr:FHA domain-containing protein [bacterium]
MTEIKAQLKIKEPGIGRYALYNIYEFPCTVGRSLNSDVVLPYSGISRTHAVIEHEESEYSIKDIESQNGLTLNGKKVKTALFNKKNRVVIGTLHAELIIEDELENTACRKSPAQLYGVQSTVQFFTTVALYFSAIYAVDLLQKWLENPIDTKEAVGLLWTNLSLMISVTILIAIAGLMGKIQVKRYVFRPILIVSFQVWLIGKLISLPQNYLSFTFNSRTTNDILSFILDAAIVLYALYHFGRQLFPLSSFKRVAVISVAIYATLFSLISISKYVKKSGYEYDFRASYSYPLLSYNQQDDSLDKLWKEMDISFEEAKEKRIEANKEKED